LIIFGKTRATLLVSFESILNAIQSSNRKNLEGQVSLFDMASEEKEVIKYSYNEKQEFPKKELLIQEKEMLGIYISGHPLDNIKEELKRLTNVDSLKIKNAKEEASNLKDGQTVIYGGVIASKKIKATKSNEMMAFIEIEDLYGNVEAIVFPKTLREYANLFIEENIVLVEGRLNIREDEDAKIVVQRVKAFQKDESKVLKLNVENEDELQRLKATLKFFSGDKNNLKVEVYLNNEKQDEFLIFATKEVVQILKKM